MPRTSPNWRITASVLLKGWLNVPTRFPLFEPETDQMGRYCQLLTHLLMSKTLSDDMERVAGDLLQDLVGYFADTLKAPRWLKTEDGMMVL